MGNLTAPKQEKFRELVEHDDNFVALKRFDYSIWKVIERYGEDGAPTKVIAQALMITEEEVEEIYRKAIPKLQDMLGVNE